MSSCITLKESNKTITNNAEPAETFNTFFSKIVPSLNIDKNLGDKITNPNITDPIFCGIQKYEKYPSFLKIKEMMGTNNLSFSFKFIDRKKIFNELQKLKSKKACQGKRHTGYINQRKVTSSQISFTTILIIHCLVHIFHQI